MKKLSISLVLALSASLLSTAYGVTLPEVSYFMRNTDEPVTVYYQICKKNGNCENAVPLSLTNKNQKYEGDMMPTKASTLVVLSVTDQSEKFFNTSEKECTVSDGKTLVIEKTDKGFGCKLVK